MNINQSLTIEEEEKRFNRWLERLELSYKVRSISESYFMACIFTIYWPFSDNRTIWSKLVRMTRPKLLCWAPYKSLWKATARAIHNGLLLKRHRRWASWHHHPRTWRCFCATWRFPVCCKATTTCTESSWVPVQQRRALEWHRLNQWLQTYSRWTSCR